MGGSAASIPCARASRLSLRLAGDDRLLGLAAAGDAAAFAQLYRRHHQDLYRYARTIVRHDEDAQDVVQTTMLRALGALGKGPPDAPPRPWLFRIAHNEAISLLRRRRPEEDVDTVAVADRRSLEATVGERHRLGQLVSDLQDLPERQRGALVMRELSGLSHEEIAAALGMGVAGAKQAILDARRSLQEFEKGRLMDCVDVQRRISDGDGRALRGRPVRAHLRACDGCRAMRDAIHARRADLAVLAPPLPAAAGVGLLAEILGGGAGGFGGGGGAAVGAAGGASAALGVSAAAKGLAAAAVVAGTGLGAVQVAAPEPVRPGRVPAAVAATAAASPAPSAAAVPAAATAAPRGTSGGTAAQDVQRDRARGPEGRPGRRDAGRPRRGRNGTPAAGPPGEEDAARRGDDRGRARRPAAPPKGRGAAPAGRGPSRVRRARPKPARPRPGRPKPSRPAKPVKPPPARGGRPKPKPAAPVEPPKPEPTPAPTPEAEPTAVAPGPPVDVETSRGKSPR